MVAFQRRKKAGRLVTRQHDRNAHAHCRTADLLHPGQINAENLLVQEQHRAQCLLVR